MGIGAGDDRDVWDGMGMGGDDRDAEDVRDG